MGPILLLLAQTPRKQLKTADIFSVFDNFALGNAPHQVLQQSSRKALIIAHDPYAQEILLQ